MSSPDLVASDVMNISAALLNDPALTNYTYTAQLPYLNLALQELREIFELNKVSTVQKTSAVIQIDANITEITFNAAGTPTNPALPDDMIEPAELWERNRDINPFIPMTRRSYLPHDMEGIEISQFIYYVWQNNKIIVLPSNTNNDIKIDYAKELFQAIVDQNTQINVINARTFLEYRTASLCAEFIERNTTSSNGLNNYAILALDRATGINIKGKQNIMTRRRPFRAVYKRRGWVT